MIVSEINPKTGSKIFSWQDEQGNKITIEHILPNENLSDKQIQFAKSLYISYQ